ncbi:hypothetical protein JZ751_028843 [Albula glossodonta]|uniref:Tektin n=1 Tax=Albula glossodonta TaxID=121402 RepID=A0A8T2NET8_9TELE|nr:hypothetical protein JZ751_028843 [Albula glossodonta]
MPPRSPESLLKENIYQSSGLATAGYRSAKYTPDEWTARNNSTFYQAALDRDTAHRIRYESKTLNAETEAKAQRCQAEGTRHLGERLQDIYFLRSELQRHIEELTAETEQLLGLKRRLEKALEATEIPYAIATDNLTCRERRLGPDLVKDEVEEQLLKEVELIRSIQALLKKTLSQAIDQIRANRDAKQTLEMDWSDKFQAYNLDVQCGRYNNKSRDTQNHPNSAKFQDQRQCISFPPPSPQPWPMSTPLTAPHLAEPWNRSQWGAGGLNDCIRQAVTQRPGALSGHLADRAYARYRLRTTSPPPLTTTQHPPPPTLLSECFYERAHACAIDSKAFIDILVGCLTVTNRESWLQFTQGNLALAGREEQASRELRQLVENVLQDTAEDLRAQCAAVDNAFSCRCGELNEAKAQLELHLAQILEETGAQERNIKALRQALHDKKAPMRVAESRLYDRAQRPKMELCRDGPQDRLVQEVGELTSTIEALQGKLAEAQQSLRCLEDTRMALERDISCKMNSLRIDVDKCMAHRLRYPTALTLSGY